MPARDRPLRILIADDHRVWTEGLALSLERHGLQPVEIVYDGRNVVEECLEQRPDVILLDIRLPGQDGLALLEELRHLMPDTTIMILTGTTDPTLPRQAYDLGADGFLSKDTTTQVLTDRIRAAHAARGAEGTGPSPRDAPPTVETAFDLTATERLVLNLIAQGLDNSAIAERLTVTENTVKTHVSNLLGKLEVPNRTLAAVWAIKHGYGQ